MRKFVYVSEMLIVRHLGTPNSGFNGCHCMRDPVLYRSMVGTHKEKMHHLLGLKQGNKTEKSPTFPHHVPRLGGVGVTIDKCISRFWCQKCTTDFYCPRDLLARFAFHSLSRLSGLSDEWMLFWRDQSINICFTLYIFGIKYKMTAKISR